MSTPEWYSGSDSSGRVAEVIEAVIARMDDHIADDNDINELEALLDIEGEPNWRAFLLGMKGTIQYDLKRYNESRKTLTDSIAGYRVFLESFDEVLSVYCQCCYTLGTFFVDDELFSEAIPFFMRCMPYMAELYDDVFIANVYSFLQICFNMTGDDHLSLVLCEATAFTRKCDCESMENLMNAYVAVGDTARATEVFEELSEHCQDYEHFDRILEFAHTMLGESGPVN